MCGRGFLTYKEEQILNRYLNRSSWLWPISRGLPAFKENYNLCPTQNTLVLANIGQQLSFRQMRWGLVPAWSKTIKDADRYSMINARIEEISEKRSYKQAFKQRRCIIPLSGFYEWQRSATKKIPYAIQIKDQAISSFAGIWESWEDNVSNQIVESFSITTTSSNSFMKNIHERMPILLSEEDENIWLNPQALSELELQSILKRSSEIKLQAYPVSNLVNSVKNNSAQLLLEVSEQG